MDRRILRLAFGDLLIESGGRPGICRSKGFLFDACNLWDDLLSHRSFPREGGVFCVDFLFKEPREKQARRLSVDLGLLELLVMRLCKSSIDLKLDFLLLVGIADMNPCRSGTLTQRFPSLTFGFNSFIVMDASSARDLALSAQIETVT